MFTVTWLDVAMDRLANMYIELDLTAQGRLADEIEKFNRQLSLDPLSIGESREDNTRVAFVDIVVLRFEIDQFDMNVRVTTLKRFAKW